MSKYRLTNAFSPCNTCCMSLRSVSSVFEIFHKRFNYQTLRMSVVSISRKKMTTAFLVFYKLFLIMRIIKWNVFGKFRIFSSSFPTELLKVPRELPIQLQLSIFFRLFYYAGYKMEWFWKIPNFLLLFSQRTFKSPKGINNTFLIKLQLSNFQIVNLEKKN